LLPVVRCGSWPSRSASAVAQPVQDRAACHPDVQRGPAVQFVGPLREFQADLDGGVGRGGSEHHLVAERLDYPCAMGGDHGGGGRLEGFDEFREAWLVESSAQPGEAGDVGEPDHHRGSVGGLGEAAEELFTGGEEVSPPHSVGSVQAAAVVAR
jgi:hypothetical protein